MPDSDASGLAWYLDFESGGIYRFSIGRNCGQSVRPIRGFAE
jgi:hypothetical protein